MNDWVVFDKFPFPPSVNESYVNSRNISGRGRFPSQKLKQFKKEVEIYSYFINTLKNKHQIQNLIGKELEIEIDFIIPYSKIYTLKGEPKVFDIDNRIKATLDGISSILGIDDKMFFKVTGRKFSMQKGNEKEQPNATIRIRPMPFTD